METTDRVRHVLGIVRQQPRTRLLSVLAQRSEQMTEQRTKTEPDPTSVMDRAARMIHGDSFGYLTDQAKKRSLTTLLDENIYEIDTTRGSVSVERRNLNEAFLAIMQDQNENAGMRALTVRTLPDPRQIKHSICSVLSGLIYDWVYVRSLIRSGKFGSARVGIAHAASKKVEELTLDLMAMIEECDREIESRVFWSPQAGGDDEHWQDVPF